MLGVLQETPELAANGHSLLSMKGGLSSGMHDERDVPLLPTAEYPGTIQIPLN